MLRIGRRGDTALSSTLPPPSPLPQAAPRTLRRRGRRPSRYRRLLVCRFRRPPPPSRRWNPDIHGERHQLLNGGSPGRSRSPAPEPYRRPRALHGSCEHQPRQPRSPLPPPARPTLRSRQSATIILYPPIVVTVGPAAAALYANQTQPFANVTNAAWQRHLSITPAQRR